jgi:predicted membrane protein DUF2232
VTSTADPARTEGVTAWLRGGLIFLALLLFALVTSPPWGALWLVVPLAVAISLLACWRFGAWGLTVPVALFSVTTLREDSFGLWAWWIPACALTGAWMGLREEGEGTTGGQRAWMLIPVLVLAAGLPWLMRYPQLVEELDRELKVSDAEGVRLLGLLGFQGERLNALERAVADNAALRTRLLPHVVPTALFTWMVVLAGAGRTLAACVATILRWPALSRARFRDWRLPDGAIWVFLVGLALLVGQWPPWTPTAWTLLLNTMLGFCVQGIAVVESLLLARGVPPSLIVLTMLFVFAVAMPIFMLTTAAVGLGDVWLDFRRLEPAADQE